ncbi:MAG: hypothetical protein IT350_19300 [Deltaproteobacteria bacterium]|nr:hypothetical protein [Deltaproteobacteria bacterium]
MYVTRNIVAITLASTLLALGSACFSGDGSGSNSGSDDDAFDDDASGDDDGSNDDDSDDDDDDTTDDDGADDDDDDAGSTDFSPSLNFGLVHYHYYFSLGGYDGDVFLDDTAWAASHVEFAIINTGDLGMDLAWEQLRADEPVGSWLKWQLSQIFVTNETAGDCSDPEVGGEDPTFAEHSALFDAFLAEQPEHGDGESCFLHARYDGEIAARWHTSICDVSLAQRGIEGSAADLRDARIFTLIWDEYGWLIDFNSDCGRDFLAFKARRDTMDLGYGGVGYDNIGGPIGDGFYLPELVDDIDVIEIPNTAESNDALLDAWWWNTIEGMLEATVTAMREDAPDAKLVFNAGAYCSWDGSVDRLGEIVRPGLGVWCEGAIQHPSWGVFHTPDRFRSFAALSEAMDAGGGFVALETFYDGGDENPTPDELVFYLAANWVLGALSNVLAIKPDWDPYVPLREATWFPVFEVDIGEPTGPYDEHDHGVFVRDFARDDGAETRVWVRGDGHESPVTVEFGAGWCRLGADASLAPMPASAMMASGDGLIVMRGGDIDCPAE